MKEKIRKIISRVYMEGRSRKTFKKGQIIKDLALTQILEEMEKGMLGEEKIYSLIMNQKYFVNGKGWVRVARLEETSANLAHALYIAQKEKVEKE